MDQQDVQTKLETLYADWKARLHFSKDESDSLSPPLLLRVTEEYCRAERRVLLFGKETFGWNWNGQLQKDNPMYPHAWPFQNVNSCSDFLANADSIEALCWGYGEFQFAAYQPMSKRGPFWQAFKEVCRWSYAGVMWANVVRMDYSPPANKNQSLSIWNAPQNLRDSMISQQASLVAAELAILDPHVCLFFSGPDCDGFIKAAFPSCEFLSCGEPSPRELARVIDPRLPTASFRTYHPNFLRLGNRWSYIETMRKLAYGDL
jgi:hypothetical protein